MLKVNKISIGQGEYYLSLERDDYYTNGGEPPGRWFGKGASKFELSGKVKKGIFRKLLRGKSPKGKSLTQKQTYKNRKRCVGFDLTFSAPKSVSIVWALSSKEIQEKIQAIHNRAVKKALTFIEQEAPCVRVVDT